MPKTTMSAANVTVLRSMPQRYMNASVTAMQMGTPELAMRAERMGNSINMTTMTTSMEITRSRRNENTEFRTTLGWSVMRFICTLSGNVCWNAAKTASTSSPKATMLLSGRISTESTSAVWPLYLTMDDGAL